MHGRYIVIFLACCTACSLPFKKGDSEATYRIRYMNVQVVYEFLVKRDTHAQAIKKRQDYLVEEIKKTELQLKMAIDPGETAKYLDLRKSLEKVGQEEQNYRKKILSNINTAVKNISAERKIDFVLRIGEDVIFAKREYDITEDVLREIVRLEKRSGPITR